MSDGMRDANYDRSHEEKIIERLKMNQAHNHTPEDVERMAEELRDKYTYVQPILVEDELDAHVVGIKIGVQSFRIADYQETKEQADWMRLMIGKAFVTLLAQARKEGFISGVTASEKTAETTKGSLDIEVYCQCGEISKKKVEFFMTGAGKAIHDLLDDPRAK